MRGTGTCRADGKRTIGQIASRRQAWARDCAGASPSSKQYELHNPRHLLDFCAGSGRAIDVAQKGACKRHGRARAAGSPRRVPAHSHGAVIADSAAVVGTTVGCRCRTRPRLANNEPESSRPASPRLWPGSASQLWGRTGLSEAPRSLVCIRLLGAGSGHEKKAAGVEGEYCHQQVSCAQGFSSTQEKNGV